MPLPGEPDGRDAQDVLLVTEAGEAGETSRVAGETRGGASDAASVGGSRQGRGWRERNRLPKSFWLFLAVTCVFNSGQFMFVLLYNLYLLDRGFKEDFLGLVASVTTAGSIMGTLLAVASNRRIGLQRTVMFCFAGGALVSAARSLVLGEWPLLGLAFLAGVFFSVWAISIAVIVAQVTTPEQRPFAFSVYLATVISVGIVADPLGGRLPGWLGQTFGAADAAQSKQWTLLLSCALIALAVVPLSRLRLARASTNAPAAYPRSPFIVRFLVAVALLNLATGAFNPFANAYFSQYLKMPVHDIGLAFSGGQLAQVVAILVSPLILRRLGVVWGVAFIEVAAGISLAFLSTGPLALGAAFGYAGYVAFQWMDEPAMESLLMTRVEPHERSGASALMYMVIFASGALAAPVAGFGLTRFGYAPVMVAAASLLVLGGLTFGLLLRRFDVETS